jgi:hypothetical protein
MGLNNQSPIDAAEPQLEKDAMKALRKERRSFIVSGDTATLLATAVTLIFFITTAIAFHSLAVGIILLPLPLTLTGLRWVPPVHNALLYVLKRRTRIGFSEGPVWIPWFLGARLQLFNLKEIGKELPEEDNWSKNRISMKYRVVIRFGIRPIQDKGFFQNFFCCLRYVWHRQTNAESLYYFAGLESMEAAYEVLESSASAATRRAINKRTHFELLNMPDPEIPEAPPDLRPLEEEILEQVNGEAEKYGLVVTTLSLEDLDVHERSAQIFEEEAQAKIRGRALTALYKELAIASRDLVNMGVDVTSATFRMTFLSILRDGAEKGGTLGQLLQLLTAEKGEQFLTKPGPIPMITVV